MTSISERLSNLNQLHTELLSKVAAKTTASDVDANDVDTTASDVDTGDANITNGGATATVSEEKQFKKLQLKRDIWGYKTANNYLITLVIPKGALTNLRRRDVTYSKTAKFRCNRATVMSIQNWITGEYVTEINSNHRSLFKYKIGQEVFENDFDMDKSQVCAEGIHFFLTPLGAYTYWYIDLKPDKFHLLHDGTMTCKRRTHAKNKQKMLKKMKKLKQRPKYAKRSHILKH